MPAEKLGREPFALFGEHYGFGLRVGIHDPSLLMKQVQQIPVKPSPDATAVMKRQRQDGERSFGQLIAVEIAWQSTRRHVGFSRSG